MGEQTILQIRETIHQAQCAENKTGALSRHLRTQAHRLHPAISLPEDNAHQVLLEFVTRYIQHVPDFLDALCALMREAGIYDQGKRFVEIAEDFFIEPPELIAEHSGMHALIDEAYLAHRLIEEVNDRVILLCGAPLLPLDMTFSNLVVHELLGEEFANQLDLAVHYAIEALFPVEALRKNTDLINYINACRSRGWNEIFQRWPCLAADPAASLQLRRLGTELVVQ
jgi:hypothetical protein